MLKLRKKPWINFQIQKMLKIRDKLFKQFKVSNSSTTFKVYKQFRNRVVNEIRQSKKYYYQQYFHENKSNMKLLWKGIKDIISLKPNSSDTFSHLVDANGSKFLILCKLEMNLMNISQMYLKQSLKISQELKNLLYPT